MTKKTKILISCLVALVAVSLIAGFTYAFFTSETKTNINITSGNVSIVTTIGDITTSSYDWDEAKGEYVVTPYEDGRFTLGGHAGLNKEDNSILEIVNMTPGDAVYFPIYIKNSSTIAIQYRVRIAVEDGEELFAELTFDVETDNESLKIKDLGTSRVSGWVGPVTAPAEGEEDILSTLDVTIQLPHGSTKQFEDGYTCSIVITVEAVQSNGTHLVEDGIEDTQVTASTTISKYADDHDWIENTVYTSITMDKFVTLTTTKAGSNGTYADSSWYLYESTSDTPTELTITVPDGYELESFVIKYSGGALNVENDVAQKVARALDLTNYGVVETGARYAISNSNTNSVTLVVSSDVHITDVEVVYRAVCDHDWNTDSIVWVWSNNYKDVTATFRCKNCGVMQTIEATVTESVTEKATCTDDGTADYKAEVVFEGVTYTDTKTGVTVKALGHDLKDVEAKAATCTEDGYTAHKACSRCDYKENYETVSATGHSYDKWEKHDDKQHKKVCSECGDIQYEDHKWVDDRQEATCTTEGSIKSECSVCGETKEETLSVINHSYGEWIDATDGDCKTQSAVGHYECSMCGNWFDADKHEIPDEKRFGNYGDHSYGEWEQHDDEQHKKVCSKCDDVQYDNHTPEEIPAVDPTCDTAGSTAGSKCSVCDEILTAPQEILAAHKLGDKVVAKDATCTEDGNIAYYECSVCHKYFEDAEAKEELKEVVIKAGHVLEDVPKLQPTCTEDGYTAHQKCKNCDYTTEYDVLEATGHEDGSYEHVPDSETHNVICGKCGKVIRNEDCEDYLEDGTCSKCNHEYEQLVVGLPYNGEKKTYNVRETYDANPDNINGGKLQGSYVGDLVESNTITYVINSYEACRVALYINVYGGKSYPWAGIREKAYTVSVNGVATDYFDCDPANNELDLFIGYFDLVKGDNTIVITFGNAEKLINFTSITVAPTSGDGEESKFVSLAVNADAATKEFDIDGTFSWEGIVVRAYYSNGTSKLITTGYTVHEPDMATPGDKKVTVEYQGLTAEYTITVKDTSVPELTGITVDVSEATTEFVVGGEFSYDGIKVTATYLKGAEEYSEPIEMGYTVSSPDMSKVGTQTVTVTYDGKTATYDIYVMPTYDGEAALTYEAETAILEGSCRESGDRVENITPGDTITFKFYSTFEGTVELYISVAGQLNGGGTVTNALAISVGNSEDPIYIDVGTNGWVNYAEQLVCRLTLEKDTYYTIVLVAVNANTNVNLDALKIAPVSGEVEEPTLERIEINTDGVQKQFYVGETFSYNGLVVTAYYSNDTHTVLERGYTVTGPTLEEMLTTGTKTVTVTYIEGDVTCTATYEINVIDNGSTDPEPGEDLPTYNGTDPLTMDATDDNVEVNNGTKYTNRVQVNASGSVTFKFNSDVEGNVTLSLEIASKEDRLIHIIVNGDRVVESHGVNTGNNNDYKPFTFTVELRKDQVNTIEILADETNGAHFNLRSLTISPASGEGEGEDDNTLKYNGTNTTFKWDVATRTGGSGSGDYLGGLSNHTITYTFKSTGNYDGVLLYVRIYSGEGWAKGNYERPLSDAFTVAVSDGDNVTEFGPIDCYHYLTNGEVLVGTIDLVEGRTYTVTITIRQNPNGFNFYNMRLVPSSEAPELDRIEVDAANANEFNMGDTFSADGIVVLAYYSNGAYKVLADTDYEVTKPDMNTAGAIQVTVTYLDKTTTYEITVKDTSIPDPEWALEKITLEVESDEKVYLVFSGSYSYYGQEELRTILRSTLKWDQIKKDDWSVPSAYEMIFVYGEGTWDVKVEITVGSMNNFMQVGRYFVDQTNSDHDKEGIYAKGNSWQSGEYAEAGGYRYEFWDDTFYGTVTFKISKILTEDDLPKYDGENNLTLKAEGATVTVGNNKGDVISDLGSNSTISYTIKSDGNYNNVAVYLRLNAGIWSGSGYTGELTNAYYIYVNDIPFGPFSWNSADNINEAGVFIGFIDLVEDLNTVTIAFGTLKDTINFYHLILAPTISYEGSELVVGASKATAEGCNVEENGDGYDGNIIGGIGEGSVITYTIFATAEGTVKLSVSVAGGVRDDSWQIVGTQEEAFEIVVNGTSLGKYSLGTFGWTNFEEFEMDPIEAMLNAGENTIEIRFLAGNANFSHITLSPANAD